MSELLSLAALVFVGSGLGTGLALAGIMLLDIRKSRRHPLKGTDGSGMTKG